MADLRKEKRTQEKPRPKTKPQTTGKQENQKAEPIGAAARHGRREEDTTENQSHRFIIRSDNKRGQMIELKYSI